MAAADLRAELTCSVCRDFYSDPVTLQCDHNFCFTCIERTWDWQKSIEEDPSCPICRMRYRRKPELERNLRLRNIVKQFLSDNMKCSSHNEMLEYYCYEESVCVCESCWQEGEHRGHRVELLTEASEKKKEKLREVLEKLRPEREETERGAQRLKEQWREVEIKAAGETETVTRDIREWLETLVDQVARDISRQKEKISLQLWNLIQLMEIKKDELSRKIRHFEEVCNVLDPLTVLQDQESDAFCGAEGRNDEDNEMEEKTVPVIGDLTIETFLTGLGGAEIVFNEWRIYGQEATDLLLDRNTAGNHVSVLGDGKSASYSPTELHYPQSSERFQDFAQTLSTRSFSSGRHYWEVEGSESGHWKVGMIDPSIERRGAQSCIGDNNKSWCLCRWENIYSVTHNMEWTHLSHVPSSRRIRITLDYGAGRLSFYELSEPIRHLHTFTATFTEPLHAAFWVWEDTWVRIIS